MIIFNNEKVNESWIRDLHIEESEKQFLPWHVAQMLGAIGLNATVDILKLFGGLNLHIPKLSSTFAYWRNKAIQEQFDGSNHRELAKEFGISEKYCKDILRASRETAMLERGKDTASRLEPKLNEVKP
jgi:Mor family transcriptional regulator